MSLEHTSTTHTLTTDARAALDAGDVDTLMALSRARYGGWRMELDGGGAEGGTEGGEGDPAGDEGGDGGTEDTGAPADETDPRVQRANRQAAQYRTQLREAQQTIEALQTQQSEQGTVLQALRAALTGETGGDEGADPAEQVATLTSEAENLRTEVSNLRAELQVYALAGDAGANPTALLDSRTFTTTLHGLDPAAEDYTEQVATAIREAVSKNASLSATAGQGPSRGGAPGAGQGPAQPAGAVTQEQFDAMPYRARTELFRTNPDLYRRLAGAGT